MTQLIDAFGRQITYLRLSVTDRCDFRCVYCMSEDMTFLPRAQILTIEEMTLVAQTFTELGVKKIRITGGEPLIRRNINQLFSNLGQLEALEELTLTTNGSHLAQHAQALIDAGVKRINVSLDSVDPQQFTDLTRTGELKHVLAGIDTALAVGLHIKLNAVILKNRNYNQLLPLVEFALNKNIDISFIEEMPLGSISEHQRLEEFVSSSELRHRLEQHYQLAASTTTTGGPSRYWQVNNSKSLIGFISPHSDNFCSSCNRVRVTAEGKLLLCLGNEHSLNLRKIIRQHPGNSELLKQQIVQSMSHKPEKHHFDLNDEPDIVRFMNMTGG